MRPTGDFSRFVWISRYPILICILFSIMTQPVDCSRAMKRLFEDLFSDYNRLILPVANNRSKAAVTLGLKLGQILDLNLKQQILSTNIWVEQSWFDYKLTWDPAQYQGIDMIHVPAENIWIPDIVLFNNADGNYELTMMTKAKVFYNGSVVWKPPTMFKSTCEIDVSYFPFDVQVCLLRFGSWTYAGDELELKLADRKAYHQDPKFPHTNVGIDLSEFHTNVEWDIIEVPAIYNEEYYDCCTSPIPDITFKIVIRRKLLFYTVNLILPTLMMAFMTLFVFYLPSKSDEKVTLSISILMSLIVFFTMMLEIIPASSLAVSLFGKYLLFTLVLVSTSTCVTVFVLNIHYRSPSVHTMSPWMKKVFLEILPWWLGMKRPDIKERSSLMRFRKKRAKKLLCSNNRVHDSSMSTNNSLSCNKKQLSLNDSKLSDLIEETEDEEMYEDDEGRYFRRHIDKYRQECATMYNNRCSSFNCRNLNKINADGNQRRYYARQEAAAQTGNLRNRSTSTNFISLDSNNTEIKTMLDSGHSIGQQPKDSNNSLRSKQSSHICVQATLRHPHVYMHNEDTLDMTFDYDDELPTPPPPPPLLPPIAPPPPHHRPNSRLNVNNDNDEQQLLTTLSASHSGYLDNNSNNNNFGHDQQQMISLDASSSSNDNQDFIRDPSAFQVTSFMQQDGCINNINIDSSVNDDDDNSNNESYQSSLLMNQLMNGGSTLDARLLLDSSIDNNDSGQTVLTKQADSCTCWELTKPVAALSCHQQQYNGELKNIPMTSSTYRSAAFHQQSNNMSQQSGSRGLSAHHQLNNISQSNYSSSTGAAMPPPPPMLQSTILDQHQSNGDYHHLTTGNNNYSHSIGKRSVHLDDDNSETLNNYDQGSMRKTLFAGKNINTSNLHQSNSINAPYERMNDIELNSVLMSLTLPYDQMPQYLKAAIRHILFIADTIKNEDVENRAVEDWNFMSMVIDRLFLWLFFVLCSAGSFMLLMFAPSLYDNRPSIEDIFIKDDIPMNNCSAVYTSLT